MPFAPTNDGQEIYCERHEGDGPTLVLIPGYMGIADLWQPVIQKLHAKNYQCITLDLRGYGRSSKPESATAYTVPRHAEDVHAVLTFFSVAGPITLVTHSMGGNIASAFTLANPDRVARIVSSGSYFDGNSFRDRGLRPDHIAPHPDVPSACVQFYVGMGLDPGLAGEAAKWPAYARWNNALALFAYGIGDAYSRIKVPCLIVQGSEDEVTPVEACVRPILEAMPTCTLEVLDGVNHFPATEAVEEFSRLVDEFVQSTGVVKSE